jgi:hypothetical protein
MLFRVPVRLRRLEVLQDLDHRRADGRILSNGRGGIETKPVVLGAALLMLAIVSASASPFSALYAFGDSLSDARNTFIATGGAAPPAPPYASVNGYAVFSNGPVWVHDSP